MYINKDGKFYKQELIELSTNEILELLNTTPQQELEDFNFRINSENWEIKKSNGEKFKISPEGDITEFLEGDFIGEQLFTYEAMIRETQKRNKRVPTDDEFDILLKSKEDLKNIKLAGYRLTDGVTFSYRGYYTYLWSSTPSASNACSRFLDWINSSVYHYSDSQAFGFSVRCLKD